MPFSKDLKAFDPLLFKEGEPQPVPVDLRRRRESDLASNFYLIFSVQELVELKQDTHRFIRRLSSLCLLVTGCVAAFVGLWLLEVMFGQ
jgi:hypothetical protein